MSDLDHLPDLAGDVRERVVTPPYVEVSRRVRTRRLRGAAGSITAVVLAVAGFAVWQESASTTTLPVPRPADGTPAPDQEEPLPMTEESMWRSVVDGTGAHPFQTSGTDDGSIAVVWRALEQPEPTFALVVREPDGSVHGRRLDGPVDLTPVPGGWVGLSTARGFLIGSDGSWTDLGDPGAPREARAGDVFVSGEYAVNRLYSPADQTWSTMPTSYGNIADGYVTAAGELVTCGPREGGVTASTGGSTVSRGLPRARTCVVAGLGDSAAVVGLGDDPDGGIPMAGLVLRRPERWTVVDTVGHDLDGVASVVVTPDGSTVVTDASEGRWLLVSADGDVIEPERLVGEAFVAGDRLYVTSRSFGDGPIAWSDDDGATWHETTLPGRESGTGSQQG